MKTSDYNGDAYLTTPVRTADGRKWVQRCFVCEKVVNFIQTFEHERVQVGELVRHKKCRPDALK